MNCNECKREIDARGCLPVVLPPEGAFAEHLEFCSACRAQWLELLSAEEEVGHTFATALEAMSLSATEKAMLAREPIIPKGWEKVSSPLIPRLAWAMAAGIAVLLTAHFGFTPANHRPPSPQGFANPSKAAPPHGEAGHRLEILAQRTVEADGRRWTERSLLVDASNGRQESLFIRVRHPVCDGG